MRKASCVAWELATSTTQHRARVERAFEEEEECRPLASTSCSTITLRSLKLAGSGLSHDSTLLVGAQLGSSSGSIHCLAFLGVS